MKSALAYFVLLAVVLAGCGGTQPGPATAPPDGKEAPAAQHAGGDLERWYQELGKHTAEVTGITYSYVDQQANQIRYGVTTIEAKERLEAAIQKAGVPRDAVLIDLPEGALSEADPLQGCQATPMGLPEEKPARYTLTINQRNQSPGREFTLQVEAKPNEVTRGIDAYLECWDGTAWTPRYTLFSDRGADGPTAVIYSPNQPVIAIGFDAARPGRFVLPTDLKPGIYRVRMGVHAEGPHELWTTVHINL